MGNMLQKGLSWAAAQLTTHMSVAASYQRLAGGAAVPMDVVPGRPVDSRVDPDGQAKGRVKLDDEWVRFHFQPSLLPADPVRGDRLTVNGILREVASRGAQPCSGKSDLVGAMIWVDTQKVG
jgi:hypothetical protein